MDSPPMNRFFSYSLFFSVPAIGTEFTFRKTDGFHQIVQTMEPKRSKVQSLTDLFHHFRIILTVRICVILQSLGTGVIPLSFLNDPSRDQVQFGRRP